jgi:hypothetical protein
MVRTRRGWFIIAAVLALAGTAWAQPKKVAGAGDDVAYLPLDSEVVGGLDFAQIQTSSLWKKFVQPLLMSGDAQKKIAEFKAMCGIDPMTAISRVSFGLKGVGGGNPPEGVFVAHGVSKAKLTACFAKQKPSPGTEVKVDGPVAIIKPKDGQPFAITFLNDTTALGVIGTNATKAGVLEAAKGTKALKTSTAFMEMYGKTRTQDTLWMLINGNAPAFSKVGSAMGGKAKAMFGSVNVGKDVTANFRIRLATPADATQFASSIQGQVQQAQALVDKATVGSDGSDVTISIAISNTKLENLIKMIQGGGGGSTAGP